MWSIESPEREIAVALISIVVTYFFTKTGDSRRKRIEVRHAVYMTLQAKLVDLHICVGSIDRNRKNGSQSWEKVRNEYMEFIRIFSTNAIQMDNALGHLLQQNITHYFVSLTNFIGAIADNDKQKQKISNDEMNEFFDVMSKGIQGGMSRDMGFLIDRKAHIWYSVKKFFSRKKDTSTSKQPFVHELESVLDRFQESENSP